jgi:hypothetical protein
MKVGVVENILKQSGMKPGIARKAVSGLTEAATMEGLTEGAQEAINIIYYGKSLQKVKKMYLL